MPNKWIIKTKKILPKAGSMVRVLHSDDIMTIIGAIGIITGQSIYKKNTWVVCFGPEQPEPSKKYPGCMKFGYIKSMYNSDFEVIG